MQTRVYDLSNDEESELGLAEAAAVLRRGGLVVLPTDTVYGVAADAFSPAAVDALLAAKGRGRDMPVPVLVGSQAALEAIVESMPPIGQRLADAFWPGALSLVVRHTPHLSWDLGETRGTVMVRMPDHPVCQALLSRTGPLAVSSANRSGHSPATAMLDARLQLGAAVEVYLDGGSTPGPVPSSIVDLTDDAPRLLREGVLDADRLRTVAPELVTG